MRKGKEQYYTDISLIDLIRIVKTTTVYLRPILKDLRAILYEKKNPYSCLIITHA